MIDVEAMLLDAANSSESTEGDNPDKYSKNPPKDLKIEIKDDFKIETKTETKTSNTSAKSDVERMKEEAKAIKESVVEEVKDIKESIKIEEKQQIKEEQSTQTQEKKTIVENKNVQVETREKLGPIMKPRSNNNNNIDVGAINKIIEMKEILDNYNPTELGFVKDYFQEEESTSGEVIYKALVADYRGLKALDKIVEARGHTAADRAFFLMELDNNSIGDIYEQVDLLTGELEENMRVTEINKISICRTLENTIANMGKDVFTYITKLQEFTNRAISE